MKNLAIMQPSQERKQENVPYRRSGILLRLVSSVMGVMI